MDTKKESNTAKSFDLTDSKRDEQSLQPEETIIELPDVEDIPGQENIVVPPLGELADTTISSADEEGEGIFDDDEEGEDYDNGFFEEEDGNPDTDTPEKDADRINVEGDEGNVSDLEKELLNDAEHGDSKDELALKKAALDNTDFDNVPLNEGSFKKDLTGDDLDVANTEDDDENEAIGEEDEENNFYSLDDDDKNEGDINGNG